jgi:hypothetical protein
VITKPSECKWCRCGVRSYGQFTTFKCWTSLVLDNGWSQSTECKLKGLEDRIQRAVDTLKKAKRYMVTPQTRRTIEWEETVDGIVTESWAVDEALAILEGERDGET